MRPNETVTGNGAVFDPTRTWRYYLWRRWQMDLPPLVCVLLNPSVANESDSDHTVTKLMQFARQWAFGGLDVFNIFSVCSTNPKFLYTVADPVGPDNNHWLASIPSSSSVVCAWGRHGEYRGRGYMVARSLTDRACKIRCFGKCSNGEPKHPLMLGYKTELRPFSY